MRSPGAQPSYDEQRMAWRKSLPEGIVRTLAADYLRGQRDDCNYDAYLEYLERFGAGSSRRLRGWAQRGGQHN